MFCVSPPTGVPHTLILTFKLMPNFKGFAKSKNPDSIKKLAKTAEKPNFKWVNLFR